MCRGARASWAVVLVAHLVRAQRYDAISGKMCHDSFEWLAGSTLEHCKETCSASTTCDRFSYHSGGWLAGCRIGTSEGSCMEDGQKLCDVPGNECTLYVEQGAVNVVPGCEGGCLRHASQDRYACKANAIAREPCLKGTDCPIVDTSQFQCEQQCETDVACRAFVHNAQHQQCYLHARRGFDTELDQPHNSRTVLCWKHTHRAEQLTADALTAARHVRYAADDVTWLHDPEGCADKRWQRTCTPEAYRCLGKGCPPEPYVDPCCVLRGLSVLFVGDSFVRHAFVAALLLLSGDYEAGALRKGHDAICRGAGQFEEKACRMQLVKERKLCDGTVVRLRTSAWPTPTTDEVAKYDIVIWGCGNHPPNLDYSPGRPAVNDAALARALALDRRSECSSTRFRAYTGSRVIWLSQHVRLNSVSEPELNLARGYHTVDPDESVAQQLAYHREMPVHLREVCNVTHFTSIWNATMALTANPHINHTRLTYDGMHWGVELNLLKARAIVAEAARMLSRRRTCKES